MIISGVFDRFPRLQMVGVEAGCGWIPYVLEQLDDRYWRNRKWANCDLKMQPSDYYRRNWHSTFMKRLVRAREPAPHRRRQHDVVDRLPAPRLRVAVLAKADPRDGASACRTRSCSKILADNAVELYGLE